MTLVATYLSKWPVKSDTHRTMRSSLNRVAQILGSTDAESHPWQDLRYDVARGVAAKLQEAGLGPATVNRCLVAVRGVLETASSMGLLPAGEHQRIKIKNVAGGKRRAGHALDPKDVEAFEDAVSRTKPRDAALLVVLFACGLRRVEAARLRREDYDPGRGEIQALGKGNKPRTVPVEEDWRPVLEAHWRTLPPRAPMFSSRQGGLTRSGVSCVVEAFCRASSIRRFTPHDLRRTFGTRLLRSGVDVFTVQDLMGHVSVETTKIYDHRGEEAKAKAVKAMGRTRKSQGDGK